MKSTKEKEEKNPHIVLGFSGSSGKYLLVLFFYSKKGDLAKVEITEHSS